MEIAVFERFTHGSPRVFCEKKEIAVREECVDLSMTKTVSV